MRPDCSFFCLVLLTGTTGCSYQKMPLIEDNSETATKVRFVSPQEMGWIDLYPETDCNNGARVIYNNAMDNFVEPLRGNAPKRIGMIDSPDPNSWEAEEYSFKGGQTINIAVSPFPGRCLSGLSFPTEPGSQYEVVVTSNTASGCTFKLSKLTIANGSPHREPITGVGPLICK